MSIPYGIARNAYCKTYIIFQIGSKSSCYHCNICGSD